MQICLSARGRPSAPGVELYQEGGASGASPSWGEVRRLRCNIPGAATGRGQGVGTEGAPEEQRAWLSTYLRLDCVPSRTLITIRL